LVGKKNESRKTKDSLTLNQNSKYEENMRRTTKQPEQPRLRCLRSNQEFPIGPYFNGSPAALDDDRAAPLEMTYDYEWHTVNDALQKWSERPLGVWSYRELLPLPDTVEPVTLMEGGTPLIRLPVPGPGRLWIKDETRNPTGAFKDRFHTVSISMAKVLGFKKVTASTTGNHGTSLAAYSTKAGLKCLVFADPNIPEIQRRLIQLYGAQLAVLTDRNQHLSWLVNERDWYPSTGTAPMPICNPFGLEGYKTIAYEIYFQLGAKMPHRVLAPVAGGDALYGPWKGFSEIQRLGASGPLPRMFAAQAEGCDPIVQGFKVQADQVPVHPAPQTIALSIGDPTGGDHALTALYQSDGGAEAVSDNALIDAIRLLADIGIAAEPSATASVAAALAQQSRGEITADEDIVCIVTGSAVKWPDIIPLASRQRELCDERPEAIRAWISSIDDSYNQA
jgi:threonine synthase